MRRLPVAAGAAELLVVRVERRRRVGMQHPAHVGLVDAHPERHRRGDDADRAVEEGRHRGTPLLRREPGVVERHLLTRERVLRRLGGGVRGGVDDPRPFELQRRGHQLPVLVLDRLQPPRRELDVRPVEVAHHDLGLAQAESPDDLVAHRLRGGGGERHPHRHLEVIRLRAQPHVVGPEVVPPLADQVRLVDGEQPRPGAPERVEGLVVGELLRREEDERAGSGGGGQRGRVLARGLVRVEHERFEACRPEMRQLVVLQRDQRRDDDRRPGPQQPGELVDGRLSASGRQHREDVAPFGRRGSGAQLSRAKPAEPEAVARELADPLVDRVRHGATARARRSGASA